MCQRYPLSKYAIWSVKMTGGLHTAGNLTEVLLLGRRSTHTQRVFLA